MTARRSTRELLTLTCRTTVALLGCAAMLGCAYMPQPPKVDFVEATAPRPAAPATANTRAATGSLFHAASYVPGFEDRRARMVGDTVTINIVENVSASQKTLSTINRTASTDAGITAFPMLRSADLAKAAVGASSNNAFSGKGDTESTNTFSGTITATVVEVLPNGHLVVTGDKQIGVGQNVDVLRFSGTVDPRLVQPGSVINSTQVANVRVESKGRGAQQEAQTMGWMARFFLTLLPF